MEIENTTKIDIQNSIPICAAKHTQTEECRATQNKCMACVQKMDQSRFVVQMHPDWPGGWIMKCDESEDRSAAYCFAKINK